MAFFAIFCHWLSTSSAKSENLFGKMSKLALAPHPAKGLCKQVAAASDSNLTRFIYTLLMCSYNRKNSISAGYSAVARVFDISYRGSVSPH
jgi:hypothetical protein